MRALLLLPILLVAATAASAQERVIRHGDDEVRIFESPCVHAGTMALLNESVRDLYKKAEGRINGQRYYACWRQVGSLMHVMWEDGDQGMIPAADFKDAVTI